MWRFWKNAPYTCAQTQQAVKKFETAALLRSGLKTPTRIDTYCSQRLAWSRSDRLTRDERGYHQELELVGYRKPVIIDCDPAKRPQNTKNIIFSEFCGPATPVSWDHARQIMREAGSLARVLQSIQAESNGDPPPGSKARSFDRIEMNRLWDRQRSR